MEAGISLEAIFICLPYNEKSLLPSELMFVNGAVGLSEIPVVELSHRRREYLHDSLSPRSARYFSVTVICRGILFTLVPKVEINTAPLYTPGAAFAGISTPIHKACTFPSATSTRL